MIRGNLNNDLLIGGAGSDRLFGGGGNDVIQGGADRDFLLGENGDDVLDGGTGNDNLRGGAGADEFIFASGYGFDRILDWEDGIDTINLSHTDATEISDLSISAKGSDIRIDFGAGNVIYIDSVSIESLDNNDFIFL